MVFAVTSEIIIVNIPAVIVNDIIGRLNKGVVDDLQAAVHHRDSHQFQTLSSIALKRERNRRARPLLMFQENK